MSRYVCQCRGSQVPRFRFWQWVGWVQCVIPGFLLVFVPKCPMCIMVYAAMFTGLGMSFATASYVRVGMIVVCTASILYLVWRQYRKLHRSNSKTW